jgi:HK97 family phage prohead protease
MPKVTGNFIKSNGHLQELPKGLIETKDFATPSTIMDVDKETVTGYAAMFGNKDLDDDIIMPGAFKKSIAENGPNGTNQIKFLWQHIAGKVLGKPSVLKEDNQGLYYECKINTGTSFGKDALILIADGLVEENSIGFVTVKSAIQQPDTQNWETWYRELMELDLYEHSAVTWGANPMARMTGMKSLTKEQLGKKEVKLMKALREPGLRDDTYRLLEYQIKQINTEYYNLGKQAVSLEEKQAAMMTCPNCTKDFQDTDTENGDEDIVGDEIECPNCKCMFTKSTRLVLSRKSLLSGFGGLQINQLNYSGFKF